MLKRNTAILFLSLMSVIPLLGAAKQRSDRKTKLPVVAMGGERNEQEMQMFAETMMQRFGRHTTIIVQLENRSEEGGDFGGPNGAFARALQKGFNSKQKK